MNEKRHTIELPKDAKIALGQGQLDVTKEEARAIRAQCEKIEQEPDMPDVRAGDVWKDSLIERYYLNTTGENTGDKPNWQASSGGTAVWCNPNRHVYVVNLFDLLQQGPILVGLTEEEAGWPKEGSPAIESRNQKMDATLAAYRERKDQP